MEHLDDYYLTLFGHIITPCCNQLPTLRIGSEFWSGGVEITGTNFICRVCNRKGGLGITEAESAQMWNNMMHRLN